MLIGMNHYVINQGAIKICNWSHSVGSSSVSIEMTEIIKTFDEPPAPSLISGW